jgi:zinc protease
MKVISFYIICFALLFNTAMKAQKVFPYEYIKKELDNGLQVILIPMEGSGLVSYYSVVRTGSRDEWEPGKSGFAHFFEHMMFRGTEKYPGPVYDSIITSIGADANAYTSDDLTVYHLDFTSADLEKVIDLESDRFQNLKYPKEDFQTESGAIYGEYRKGRTSPFSVAIEKLREIAYEKHTYKHTTIGFESDIKDMPNLYDYSISFYNRYYRPENIIVVITGDFVPDKTFELIKKYYDSWKPGYVEPEIETEPEQKQARFAEVQYEGRTLPLIIQGYKMDAFDPANKSYVAASLLEALAFGQVSDIYKKLVLDEQKVQMLSAGASSNRDPGLFRIYSMVKNENDIDYVREEIAKTINKFRTEPVDEKLLNDLKRRERYSFLMNLDTPERVAGALPYFLTVQGRIEIIDEFYTQLEKITPDDIMEAANKYLIETNKNEVILKGRS